MASEHQKELPQFQPFATASGFLTDAEIDRLLAEHASLVSEGKLAAGNTNAQIRRSQIVMLGDEQKYDWLYDRIWSAAQECNRLFFCVDIVGVETNLQLGRYDSSIGVDGDFNFVLGFRRPNSLGQVFADDSSSQSFVVEGEPGTTLWGYIEQGFGEFWSVVDFTIDRLSVTPRVCRP